MLHSAISDTLKNVTSGRTVKYQAEPYVWTDSAGSAFELYWIITRTAQSSFQYVALTKAGAESAAQSLVETYTRPYARWRAELDESTTPPTPIIIESNSLECSSDVTPAQSEGSAWEVDVDVNDSDTVIVTEKPETYADMERLFTLAFARDAKEDGATSIVVTEAHWDSATGKVAAFYDVVNVAAFSPSLVAVERKQGALWVNVPLDVGAAGSGGVTFAAVQNVRFRVSYNSGAVVSNEYVTNDAPIPALSMENGTWNRATQQADGSIRLTIPFSASGVPQALSGITNPNAWTVRVVGSTTGTDYSAAWRGQYALVGTSRPREVVDLGGGLYSMTYWVPALINPADTTLSVTIALQRGDGPSASASASFVYAEYFDIESATLLDATPAQTRVRLAISSDLIEPIVRRATISVVGRYPGVGGTSDRMATGTVEKLYSFDGGANGGPYSLVIRFTTLEYRMAAYPLSISGTISDPVTGLVIAFATSALQALTVQMPAAFLTEVAAGSAEGSTVMSYKAYDVTDDHWSASMFSTLVWNPVTGAFVGQAAVGASGSPPDYQLSFNSDLTASYIRGEGPTGADFGRFITPGAIFTRIVSATWADGEISIVLDQQHAAFDPSLLAVYDATTGETLPSAGIADTVTATLDADGTAHSIYLVYNSTEKSNTVSVQAGES